MIIHNYAVKVRPGETFHRFLMSDLHLGSSNSDHASIERDLDRAQSVGARVLINGDVFDGICATDKRYDAEVLHPSVRGEKDLTRAIVNLAFEMLRPRADIIDVIGIGNHEEAWIRYNHGDPVRLLIEMLNRECGTKIRHGSFWGRINTKFQIDGTRQKPIHKLLYFHGTGGDSPVTKGTIDMNRKGRNWSYDCLTFGHKHNLACTAEQIAETDNAHHCERRQLNLQTASYYQNYVELPEDDPLAYSYAASKAHPPKPIGGLYLSLTPEEKAGRWEVSQDFGTRIFSAPKRRKASAA